MWRITRSSTWSRLWSAAMTSRSLSPPTTSLCLCKLCGSYPFRILCQETILLFLVSNCECAFIEQTVDILSYVPIGIYRFSLKFALVYWSFFIIPICYPNLALYWSLELCVNLNTLPLMIVQHLCIALEIYIKP